MNTSHPVYVVGFMSALALGFGSVVAGLHASARGVVLRNEQLLEQRAIVEVFHLGPAATLSAAEVRDLVARRVGATEVASPSPGESLPLLIAYTDDARSQVAAYGTRFSGPGFWAPIKGLLAVSPDLHRTIGLVILSHSETPGLGGRITEPALLDQFGAGLDISPPQKGGRFLRMTTVTPEPGDPHARRTVMAITGATQTSAALERMINAHLATFMNVMQSRRPEVAP